MFDNNDEKAELQGYQVEPDYSAGTPKIVQWVMKYSGGYVKDERQAGYVLIAIVALASVLFFCSFSREVRENLALKKKLFWTIREARNHMTTNFLLDEKGLPEYEHKQEKNRIRKSPPRLPLSCLTLI